MGYPNVVTLCIEHDGKVYNPQGKEMAEFNIGRSQYLEILNKNLARPYLVRIAAANPKSPHPLRLKPGDKQESQHVVSITVKGGGRERRLTNLRMKESRCTVMALTPEFVKTITIAENGRVKLEGGGDPRDLVLKAGTFLRVINRSDRAYIIALPSSGLITRVIRPSSGLITRVFSGINSDKLHVPARSTVESMVTLGIKRAGGGYGEGMSSPIIVTK